MLTKQNAQGAVPGALSIGKKSSTKERKMDEPKSPGTEGATSDVASEFKNLGENLKTILQNAWESEERKHLQREIESGLSNLGQTLDEAAREFRDSDAGQRLKADAEDFRNRVRSGEVEHKVREDLLAALRKVNTELEKILSPKSPPGDGE
jgi:hypothetical protein